MNQLPATQGPLVVYISGPYTALRPDGSEDPEAIAANVAEAVRWGHLAETLGVVAVVPHVAVLATPGMTWDEAMRKCLALLKCCDAVLMMPTWTSSRGAVAEYEAACDEGKGVCLDLESLRDWVMA